MKAGHRTLLTLLSSWIALLIPGGLYAAELEEIVVTAQHRAENVQDIPISVSALGGELLAEADIHDATEIANNVPGMAYAEFAPGQALVSMRGIISADDGAGMDNSVTLFLDGVYIGRPANINFDLFDLERIEVLRGPQGTLFGRNAIGGAINVVTARPSQETQLKLAGTVGNEDIIRYQGLINGAIANNLSGKLTYNHREHEGYGRNVLLNEETQDEDQDSVRGQLLWEVANTEWLLSADYMQDDREDMGRTPIVNGNFDYVGTWQSLGGGVRKTTAPIDGFSEREAQGVSLQGDIEFNTGTFTTISAWRDSETDWEMPSVGAPLGGNFDLDAGVFGADVNDDINEDIEQFSQEFRWTSDLEGIFNYVVGLYYMQEKTDRTEQFKIDLNTTASGQTTLGNELSEQNNETNSYALYGQAQWDFNETWSLAIGARYTFDDKETTSTTLNCGQQANPLVAGDPRCVSGAGSLGILPTSFRVTADENWEDFSPKVSLEYHPNDNIMWFVTAAKGFKSGGFAGAPGVVEFATDPVSPEEAWNYELGMKGDLLENTLRLNLTGFYTDYEDLQVVRFGPSVLNPGFGSFITTNIGTAKMSGAELEFTWFAMDNLQLTGNYAYLESEVNDFVLETTGGPVDISGSSLRQAPKNKSNLAANYDYPLDDRGLLKFRLDYSHTDAQISDYLNQATRIDQFELFNARAAWQADDGTLEVAIWGKNLKDEDYISHSYVIGPGVIGVWGAPRTYGLTVTWSL